MLTSFIARLCKAGISFRYDKSRNRNIFLTNVIALVICALLVILLVTHTIRFSFESPSWILLFNIIICYCVPLLNKAGYFNLSRYVVVLNVILGLFLIAILRKFGVFDYESTYFVNRSGMLIFSVMLPIALFHNRERISLIVTLLIGLLMVMLYDPIHNLFGVGYYQMGNDRENYYYNNFFYLIMFSGMTTIMIYLKKTMEDYEDKYEQSIHSLSEKNLQIEKQRMELAEKNSLLVEVLSKKDYALTTVNQELIRKNNDLLQFSFAISHNVRGPVATILGLMGILERKPTKEESKAVLQYLSKSIKSLDTIIQGLNRILESREDTFNIKEKVDLRSELNRIEEFLEPAIKQNHVSLSYRLDVDNLFTIKTYIQDILSQLIANGIQFRSPQRRPVISVITARENGAVIICVEDNGLGLDMERHKEDLFLPFKRFHPTSSGKGIGLYLVKLEVEKLHGTIDVLSKPEKGFSVTIRLNDESHRMN